MRFVREGEAALVAIVPVLDSQATCEWLHLGAAFRGQLPGGMPDELLRLNKNLELFRGAKAHSCLIHLQNARAAFSQEFESSSAP
jgi:hypothetical protein